jgi:hypothetical protein
VGRQETKVGPNGVKDPDIKVGIVAAVKAHPSEFRDVRTGGRGLPRCGLQLRLDLSSRRKGGTFMDHRGSRFRKFFRRISTEYEAPNRTRGDVVVANDGKCGKIGEKYRLPIIDHECFEKGIIYRGLKRNTEELEGR